jgi:4-hydroxy 2-oxovalerate aldolase
MKNLTVLDCTLRDGGYYNDWHFSKDFINDYLKTIYNSGIEFVELGFSQIKKNKLNGICYDVDNKLIGKLKIPRNLKIGIMVNASDLISKNYNTEKFKKFILKKKRISLLRIACHFEEVSRIIPFIKTLKKTNLKLAINLMQISEQKKTNIVKVLKKLSKEKIDIIYFADSLGCMSFKDIKEIILLFKKNCKAQIGFHAHDNMGNAKNNVLTAIKNGSNWIDTTVFGMGRGAGNAKTEDFVTKDKKKIINQLKKRRFVDLKDEYKWGFNKYYNLSAKYKIHPTYIQKILNNLKISEARIIKIINNLKNLNSKKFTLDTYNKLLKVSEKLN